MEERKDNEILSDEELDQVAGGEGEAKREYYCHSCKKRYWNMNPWVETKCAFCGSEKLDVKYIPSLEDLLDSDS